MRRTPRAKASLSVFATEFASLIEDDAAGDVGPIVAARHLIGRVIMPILGFGGERPAIDPFELRKHQIG